MGPPPRRRGSRLGAIAFGVVLTLLIVSVPVLGYAGSQAILHGKSGKVEDIKNDPQAPGYTALVEPTPTALVVQRDAKGDPTALTVLALGTGPAGGSVLFVPLDTMLVRPALFIDRLRTAYAKAGNKSFLSQVGRLLNVGFGSVIDLDDEQWAQAVAPVAPLSIENPVAVAGPGALFPAGPIQLQADQVGPYLTAVAAGQDDLDRLARHKLVWQAWLKAISTSSAADPVPNTITGIGPFIETLSAGQTNLDTLAVTPSAQLAADGATTFQVDDAAMRAQLTDAVPAPVSPGLGDRFSVRVLNGAKPSETGQPVPDAVIRRLVSGGAQINVVGNAATFGRAVTTIEYHDPNRKDTARGVQTFMLGGKIVYNPSSTDTVDLVITIGQDALDLVEAGNPGGGDAGG